jgi:endonuclease YncB( thermonuclease family)
MVPEQASLVALGGTPSGPHVGPAPGAHGWALLRGIRARGMALKACLRLALALFCALEGEGVRAGAHEPWSDTGQLVSAPDGDTLNVTTPSRGRVTVRVAGVDAPEHGQGSWRSARAHLVAFVGRGPVAIHCYKTDQYDREVCRVKSGDDDLGASLLTAGLAWHYTRYQGEQAVAERELYAALEQRARVGQVGLWRDADPMPPDQCRKLRRAGEKCR